MDMENARISSNLNDPPNEYSDDYAHIKSLKDYVRDSLPESVERKDICDELQGVLDRMEMVVESPGVLVYEAIMTHLHADATLDSFWTEKAHIEQCDISTELYYSPSLMHVFEEGVAKKIQGMEESAFEAHIQTRRNPDGTPFFGWKSPLPKCTVNHLDKSSGI